MTLDSTPIVWQYLHTDRLGLGDYESSVHRVYRAAQYNTRADPPSTRDEILGFLSDGVDPMYKVPLSLSSP